MAELITMALFCGALIVCIIAGISIIPALLAGVVIFLAHGRLTGHTFTAMISKGFATMRAASIVVVTFVLIGLLTTLWRAAGTVSFIVTNTAGLVHPHVVVLLTFLLNCLMSLLTGSSFASAATMGVITMTLGASMQVPPVFLGGAILSGIYFGDRGFRNGKTGREAYDTECYSELEIERVARIAYELAEKRSRKVCLVDKANVLTSSRLWRKIVSDINEDYPSVRLEMMYVDNAAMQLALAPSQFDVILTSNLFGDILSDLTAAIVGSIGVMPSASLGATSAGMYEAIHGSAPTLAGLDKADPVGTILSAAMMLRLSFDLDKEAAAVEHAVETALNAGLGTPDIGGTLGTIKMTDEIITHI